MAQNLQYMVGSDVINLMDAVEQELENGWVIKTIDRTNDGEFYAFLEFPRS
jgi:hypothetical protein